MSEEKYGSDVIDSALLSAAEVVSVVYKVFVDHSGIWGLIALQGPIKSLIQLDLAKVKLQLSDYSEAEREASEAKVKAALPAALSAKIGSGLDLMEKAIDVIEDAIDFGKKGYADVLKLIADAKALFAI